VSEGAERILHAGWGLRYQLAAEASGSTILSNLRSCWSTEGVMSPIADFLIVVDH